jgi:hypothetical protein
MKNPSKIFKPLLGRALALPFALSASSIQATELVIPLPWVGRSTEASSSIPWQRKRPARPYRTPCSARRNRTCCG